MLKEQYCYITLPKWHPKQLQAYTSPAQEILLAGDTRAGKSFFVRKSLIYYCSQIPGLLCDIFRVNFDDVIRNYMEGETSFPVLLAEWERNKLCKINQTEIVFWNESRISLEHCSDDAVMQKHQGVSRHVRVLDESCQIPEHRIRALSGWVTMSNEMLARVPPQWKGQFPKLFHITNPLGVSSSYYRKQFVEARPPYQIEKVGQFTRQYIPAFVEDNPSENEENTRARIGEAFTNTAVQAALLAKDRSGITNWQVKVGSFFPQIDRAVHIVTPFQIPSHWPRFMVMDWGACGDGDPFSIGWYTIADGTLPVTSFYTNQSYPCQRNSMICYRRWNGRGLPKVTAVEVADGIHAREQREPILFRSAGGDILESRGHGESIFSIFSKHGIQFIKADNRRVNGWTQVDYRLTGENGYPLSFWFPEAAEDLETMGNLQHDISNPSDIAKGDDHDCVVGETLVDTTEGQIQIRDLVGKMGVIFTKEGEQAQFEECRLIRKGCEVWKVVFTGGREVIATPDHRFLLENDEWKELKDLRPSDKIVCVTSFIKAYHANQNHFRNLSGVFRKAILQVWTLLQLAKEKAKGLFSATSRGLAILQRAYSQGDACSSQRWGYLKQRDRKPGIASSWDAFEYAYDNPRSQSKIFSECEDTQCENAASYNGLEEKRGGTKVLQRESFSTLMGESLSSRKVLRVLWGIVSNRLTKSLSFKILPSKLQNESKTATVKEVSYHGIADVYCLTVPGFGAFSVSGGVIISNCDRHRYACMTRPVAREEVKPQDIDYRDRNRRATPESLIAELSKKRDSKQYVTKW